MMHIQDVQKPPGFTFFQNEEKVVTGTGEGVLNIFNWGEWGNISDRFPGHPMSVDCMVPYNSDIVFTGSFDGIIRWISKSEK